MINGKFADLSIRPRVYPTREYPNREFGLSLILRNKSREDISGRAEILMVSEEYSRERRFTDRREHRDVILFDQIGPEGRQRQFLKIDFKRSVRVSVHVTNLKIHSPQRGLLEEINPASSLVWQRRGISEFEQKANNLIMESFAIFVAFSPPLVAALVPLSLPLVIAMTLPFLIAMWYLVWVIKRSNGVIYYILIPVITFIVSGFRFGGWGID